MKRNIFIFLLILMSVTTHAYPSNHFIKNKINKIMRDSGENINLGILVKDLKTGKIIYSQNADRYFEPASNQKLFTAWTAYNALPATFSYQTQLFVDISKLQNGILNDNIYLKFSGDPTLTLEQFDHLISTLNTAGIHHINGNIIVDDSIFDSPPLSPGTSWEDGLFCYGAPTSTININHNCVVADLTPAKIANQPPTLTLPSYPQSRNFINNAITGGPTSKNCKIAVDLTGKNTYTVSGCIKTNDPAGQIKMAIQDPRDNLKFILNYLFNKYQIQLSQKFIFKKINISVKPFAVETSPTLQPLIAKMLKESDNSIANALFKTIGANDSHTAGNWKNGSEAMQKIILNTLQLDIPKINFTDGAGASRYIYHSPEEIIILLQKAYHSFFAKNFLAALPIAGIDGTLKNRLHDSALQGKIYAKTGTESGVTALSGYMVLNPKQILVFSIMMNGLTGEPAKYKELEDKICDIFYTYTRVNST